MKGVRYIMAQVAQTICGFIRSICLFYKYMGLQLVWATWAIIYLMSSLKLNVKSLSLEDLECIAWCGIYAARLTWQDFVSLTWHWWRSWSWHLVSMTELLRQIGSCVNILHRIMPLKGEAICEHTVTLFVFVFFFLVNPPVYEGTKELFRTLYQWTH